MLKQEEVVGRDATEKTMSSSERSIKKVSFGTIEVREHPMTLGDNPGVSGGVPVTIDWVAQTVLKFDLEMFESVKQEPRDIYSMRLPSKVRESIAIDNGFSMNQIRNRATEMKSIRECRLESIRELIPPKKKTWLQNVFTKGGETRFKFGCALEPEDYARADLPDMTKMPISVSCDGLKSVVKDINKLKAKMGPADPSDPNFVGFFML